MESRSSITVSVGHLYSKERGANIYYNAVDLQFYIHEDRYQDWELANEQGNFTVSQPVLAIYPTNVRIGFSCFGYSTDGTILFPECTQDPVANWTEAAELLSSASFTPNVTVKQMSGAHWPQLEFPVEFNKLTKEWLNEL